MPSSDSCFQGFPASIHELFSRGHKIRDTEQGFKVARIQKVLLIESAESQSPFLRVGVGSEDIGNVVFTPVLVSEVTNTWRRAFIAASNEGQWTKAFVKASASIVAVVTNASVAPCAPQKTCLNIPVTIRSCLSDPVPLSDLTA